MKFLRSTTFGSKVIVIRKSEFVAKTQFLYKKSFTFLILRVKKFQGDSVKSESGRPKKPV